jgi:hypothetical protein
LQRLSADTTSAVDLSRLLMQKHWYNRFMPDYQVLIQLDALSSKVDLILKNQEKIMTTQADIAAALAKVTQDVAAETTIDQSAIALIKGLAAQIAALAASTTDTTTAAALTALSSTIEANTTSLTAAVSANTPATPAA